MEWGDSALLLAIFMKGSLEMGCKRALGGKFIVRVITILGPLGRAGGMAMGDSWGLTARLTKVNSRITNSFRDFMKQ